jgi:hypothetical protein
MYEEQFESAWDRDVCNQRLLSATHFLSLFHFLVVQVRTNNNIF